MARHGVLHAQAGAARGELRLSAEDLTIEGLPDELGVNGKVWLSMDGALKPARTGGKAGRKVLGKLTVNLSADVQ